MTRKRTGLYSFILGLVLLFQNCGPGFQVLYSGNHSQSSGLDEGPNDLPPPAPPPSPPPPPPPPSSPPKLSDLWEGRAHFRYIRNIPYTNGRVIVAHDGYWYDFYREFFEPPTEGCGALHGSRILVRRSNNQGVSWSDSRVLATPIPNHSTMGCNIVDGDPFFDDETQTWHFLSQCIGPSGGWRMCHYTRQGRDPYGEFTSNPANPVVQPGQLWDEICTPTSSCADTSPGEEMQAGTPDIIYKRGGYFYVTFHGGNRFGTSWNGVARTQNFVQWEVHGAELPDDAILSTIECEPWNPGCAGIGYSHSNLEDNYHYILMEGPTGGIHCVPGQRWYIGWVRSTSLRATGGWEIYFRPLYTHPETDRCLAVQYPSIFRGFDGKYYFTIEDDYQWPLFELIWGAADHAVVR